jgi:hypothetical protein
VFTPRSGQLAGGYGAFSSPCPINSKKRILCSGVRSSTHTGSLHAKQDGPPHRQPQSFGVRPLMGLEEWGRTEEMRVTFIAQLPHYYGVSVARRLTNTRHRFRGVTTHTISTNTNEQDRRKRS